MAGGKYYMSYITKTLSNGLTQEFWVKDDLDRTAANYRIAFSQRGPGKSYQVKTQAIDNWINSNFKDQFGMIRRLESETKQGMMRDYWADMLDYFYEKMHPLYPEFHHFIIEPRTGAWTVYGVYEDFNKENLGIIGYYFALNISARYKSVSYPDVKMVVLEEFMAPPGSRYLTDEFDLLTNLISTIKRHRTDFVVYLLGNTVDRSNPILKAMNIDIDEIEIGELKKYTYYGGKTGENTNTVAVEYVRAVDTSDESESFFVFGRQQEDMIIKGTWQTKEYPIMEDDEFYRNVVPEVGLVLDDGYHRLYMYLYYTNDTMRAFVTRDRKANRIDYITITNAPTNLRFKQYNIHSNLKGYNRILKILEYLYCNQMIDYDCNYTGCDFEAFYGNIAQIYN